MTISKKPAVLALAVMLSLSAGAQETDDVLDAKIHEAERRLADSEARMMESASERAQRMEEREAARAESLREMERMRAELERVMQDENIEVEVRMRAAEASIAEAAQHVAELSRRQLPPATQIERIIRTRGGPVLGVTIGADSGSDPVEGVTVRGVSPGGAAEESGLRAGDVITSINGESLTAANDRAANEMLLDFMEGVEPGDELAIEYLRNGKSMQTDVTPKPIQHDLFTREFSNRVFAAPSAPPAQGFQNYFWISDGNGLGDMELVPLTERLGSYFGTDEGLLIVRAPNNQDLLLQDGDVIRSIDGRIPTSVNHAMRILGSYQSGETLKIEIMRDKKKQTLTVTVPESLRGQVSPTSAPSPVIAPQPAAVPDVLVVPKVKVITRDADRI